MTSNLNVYFVNQCKETQNIHLISLKMRFFNFIHLYSYVDWRTLNVCCLLPAQVNIITLCACFCFCLCCYYYCLLWEWRMISILRQMATDIRYMHTIIKLIGGIIRNRNHIIIWWITNRINRLTWNS